MKKNKLALGSLLMAIILLITACSGSGGSSSDGGKPVEIVMAYLAFTDVSDIQTV